MMSEALLHQKVLNYYKERDKSIFSEVPFMSRIIDLVILEGEEITSYELKVRKWKHAIEQMKEHRIASSYCYLCMPKKSVSQRLSEKIVEELNFYGFGFALWNENSGEIENVLPARKSEFLIKPGIDRLRENIRTLLCSQ
ncbi:MAG: hypothetical protein GTO45_24570 [Candidatus Aminicenantes bacterium]|nr:hypothetical protein [Candidatus Aminicenantes bacterium]NIM81929.1 hypothetical protein [Candidatus Aminicenantes bacterium]NIN21306.1 hypothetical protein [Candidatus Aminicenantes bacterium]NIN45127.1 hypothetical protein [Candidatus Aminicenantes bacterium]NIN87944.1 hypothetical protein [Candidatus Aminicenantes bacterium]